MAEVQEIKELLANHRKKTNIIDTMKISFLGADGFDVYNIAQPFAWKDKLLLPCRVETRHSEVSMIRFFESISPYLYKSTNLELEMMQDPCITQVAGKTIVGGTAIMANEQGLIDSWCSRFFLLNDNLTFTHLFDAPAKMKDVRIFEHQGIHVFTRPQGGMARGGRIGYTFAQKLADITTELIQQATILFDHFEECAWGGVNQVFLLKNHLLGILGHIAILSEGDVRHYYGMTFSFNPETKQSSQLKIICERKDFSPGQTKRNDLIDVVFPGGLIRNQDHTASLYVGLSDAESHIATMIDPFIEYEE